MTVGDRNHKIEKAKVGNEGIQTIQISGPDGTYPTFLQMGIAASFPHIQVQSKNASKWRKF